MPLPLQPGLLKAQILALLQKRPEARAVGFHSELVWEGPETMEVEGRRVRVCPARSVLEARAALALHQDADLLVLLTALSDRDLGQEAMARLERGRLLPLEPWEAVRVRMKAREVDPLLRARPDLARVLIDCEPPGGLPAAPGGVVSADHVWALLFEHALGLGPRIPDAREMLVRAFRGQVQRLVAAGADLREAAAEYLRRVRGEGVTLVQACAEAGHATQALPLGLACAVLFAPEAGRRPELTAAAARLEAFVGNRPVGPGPGWEWAEAALAALDDLDPEERRRALELGDEALDRLRVSGLAHLSPVSPRGFAQRVAELAQLLRAALEAPAGVRAEGALLAAAGSVLDHREASSPSRRAGAVQMAMRLVRWLEEGPDSAQDPSGLAALAGRYRVEGAWVDRARNYLAAGDPHPDLAAAYALLGQRVRAVRERQNEAFARALAGWTQAGSAGPGLLLIERVLDEVVVPLARSHRVLLVVLDGASGAIASELYEDLVPRGWVRRRPQAGALPPVIATVPSITEVSRASLLSGRLVRGRQDLEKSNFRDHAGLRSVARTDRPPLLHHKADLFAGSGSALNPEVASRVASDRYKVLGVVVNAVDDFLAKDDQLEPSWNLDTVRPLEALLDAAREAGRVVVMVADHGHVLEYDGASAGSGEGERWRTAERPAGEGEILVRGSRVQGQEIIVPWSEAVRYSRRHCGYHGGATPQEMLPPMLVLAPAGMSLPGWVLEGPGLPPWWDPFARPVDLVDLSEESLRAEPSKSQPPKEQLDLFAPPPPASRLPDWVRELFRSESLEAQELLAGSFALPRAVLARLLVLLRESGGEVSLETLQSHLDLPAEAVFDQVARAGQVLNMDGHPVLSCSETQVALDFSLLQKCFGPLGSGVEIEVDGSRVRLDLPMSEVEVQVLQALARHGRLTEKDLAASTGRRRIGGVVETLSLRLEKAGKPWLVCEGTGDDGRVYSFQHP